MRAALIVATALLSATRCMGGTLIGDTIEARWEYPFSGFDQTDSIVVGAGPEGFWPSGSEVVTLDVASSSISVDYIAQVFGIVSTVVWTFSSLDFDPVANITDVSVETNWTNWDDDFLSFGDDFVRVDFLESVRFDSSTDVWVLTIETIPEPAAITLLALASACVLARPRITHFRSLRL